MKKISILFLIFLLSYSIYYDLNKGTLPISNVSAAITTDETKKNKPTSEQHLFIEVNVKSGDTVLSLVEQYQKGSLPVSISSLIEDFSTLNNGVAPEKIQIGKTYKIPLYN
jgi:hypothetical protein